ncbi:hypothetical protein H7I95_14695 [Mycolicibacterium elephantis]|uniref:hypothetical protein n=1 Tax=Mycolicibacterium elephantis TaxID=81858 RepID=UPI0021F3B26C|nr:hypothetical protein [Mycolicibacterium elephantis]MCV7222154.1 hypothetical protein [Mycolicibacterium elephantis]
MAGPKLDRDTGIVTYPDGSTYDMRTGVETYPDGSTYDTRTGASARPVHEHGTTETGGAKYNPDSGQWDNPDGSSSESDPESDGSEFSGSGSGGSGSGSSGSTSGDDADDDDSDSEDSSTDDTDSGDDTGEGDGDSLLMDGFTSGSAGSAGASPAAAIRDWATNPDRGDTSVFGEAGEDAPPARGVPSGVVQPGANPDGDGSSSPDRPAIDTGDDQPVVSTYQWNSGDEDGSDLGPVTQPGPDDTGVIDGGIDYWLVDDLTTDPPPLA